MLRHYRDIVLLVAFTAAAVATLPKYQAYRFHQDTVEKAKQCGDHLKNVAVACKYSQCEQPGLPKTADSLVPKYLTEEPVCPFDGSHYKIQEILVTEQNLEHFSQGLCETVPGMVGFTVTCSSELHAKLEPGLEPGYVTFNFMQHKTELLRVAH